MSETETAAQPGREPDPQPHGNECPYGCPVCAGISLVKQTSPDVTTHLVAAAREFVMAAKTFLDSLAEQKETDADRSKIQRIRLD